MLKARPISPLTTFILSLPRDLSAKEVIAQAKAKGFASSETNVSRVRRMASTKTAEKPASKQVKKAATPKKAASSKSVTAPKETAAPGTAKSAGVSKSAFIRLHPSLASLRVTGELKPINTGDLVSVPLAATKRDPDGVLFKHDPRNKGEWVVDADAASLTVDAAAACPSMDEILAAVGTSSKK